MPRLKHLEWTRAIVGTTWCAKCGRMIVAIGRTWTLYDRQHHLRYCDTCGDSIRPRRDVNNDDSDGERLNSAREGGNR